MVDRHVDWLRAASVVELAEVRYRSLNLGAAAWIQVAALCTGAAWLGSVWLAVLALVPLFGALWHSWFASRVRHEIRLRRNAVVAVQGSGTDR